MSSMGKMDARDLLRFAQRFDRIDEQEITRFMALCARALASLLLSLTIPRTPVGKENGGSLRSGWTAKTEEEAFATRTNPTEAEEWVKSLAVIKRGADYEITISNPMFYAPYVEFGHRTRDGEGWVEGVYMLRLSMHEVRNLAPEKLENLLYDYLMDLFRV